MERGAVGVAVHGDGGDPEAARGAHDPARDLAPVRHQHLLDAPAAAARRRGRGWRGRGGRGGGEEPRGEEGQRGHGAARAPAVPAAEVEEAGGHHAVAVVVLVSWWRAVVSRRKEGRESGAATGRGNNSRGDDEMSRAAWASSVWVWGWIRAVTCQTNPRRLSLPCSPARACRSG